MFFILLFHFTFIYCVQELSFYIHIYLYIFIYNQNIHTHALQTTLAFTGKQKKKKKEKNTESENCYIIWTKYVCMCNFSYKNLYSLIKYVNEIKKLSLPLPDLQLATFSLVSSLSRLDWMVNIHNNNEKNSLMCHSTTICCC